MATDTVTGSSDDASVVGSLRYELAHAQAGDIINFASNVTSISLTASLTITKNVTIEGGTLSSGSPAVTIDGGGKVTDFVIVSGVTTTIDGLTVQNGNGTGAAGSIDAAGGIYNAGNLTLTHSALLNNKATGSTPPEADYGTNGAMGGSGSGGLYLAKGSTFSAGKKTDTFSGNSAQGGMGGTSGFSYVVGLGQRMYYYAPQPGGSGGYSKSGQAEGYGAYGTEAGSGVTGGKGGDAFGDYGGAGSRLLTVSYSGGYSIANAFGGATVTSSAFVGGTGLISTNAKAEIIVNSGTIHGTTQGVSLTNIGLITNAATGTIEGQTAIVDTSDDAVAIDNFGTILSDPITKAAGSGSATSTGYSIVLSGYGSTITNENGAVIANGINATAALITNLGTIGGTTSYTTDSSGKKSATTTGYAISATGKLSVVNGSTTNSSAAINGGITSGADNGYITNYGSITSGSNGVAINLTGHEVSLVEQGTGSISGKVLGGGGLLYFSAGAGPGTVTGLGTTITGFVQTTFTGGSWTLNGSNAVAANTGFYNYASLTNAGTFEVNTAFRNAGSLTNSGTLTLKGQIESGGAIVNSKGATLNFAADVSITTDPALKAAAFTNAGLIEKTAGTGTSIIRTGNAPLSDAGTIDVETGTLELTGTTVAISGAITGPGTIEFGVGSTTLNAGTKLTAGAVLLAGTGAHLTAAYNVSDASPFTATASTELTVSASHILTLGGAASFTRDTIDGAGRLITKGANTAALVTLGGTAQWYNAGTLTETAAVTIGDALGGKASFVNQATGIFDLAGNVGIGIGKATTSSFTNQGILEKTAGTASSTIATAIINTGTIAATSGTLDLQKTVSGAGAAAISNGATLEFDASVAAGQSIGFGTGGGRLLLGGASNFGGSIVDLGMGDTIDVGSLVATSYQYTSNAQNSGGILKLTSGSISKLLKLVGSYASNGFQLSKGKTGDTLVTYSQPSVAAATHQSLTAVSHVSDMARFLADAAFVPSMSTEKISQSSDPHGPQATLTAAADLTHR